ncbi:MAG: hypothetical protein NTZ49_04660 [Candidatus Parcubacteria bacterium]|nr:hypothetical protein [Candidatus Parcubacteria bacterium]
MTRIENENNQGQALDGMMSEIEHLKKQLKKKQSKKFVNCGTCLFGLLLVVLSLAVLAGYLAAKSGVAQIPVFSAYFYHQPEPVYEVAKISFDEKALANRISQLARAEALKRQSTENIMISLDLSEQELTALLNTWEKSNEVVDSKVKSWQIAVSPDYMQLFLVANDPENWIFTLNFIPEIIQNKLAIKVDSFKLGDLSLPKFCGSILVENVLTNSLNSALAVTQGAFQVEGFVLADKKATLKIKIFNINTLNDIF